MIWQAVHAGFAYFQREAGYTRTGSHNTRVNGRETGQWHEADLAVAHWLQHTSRDGDMQLHVHSQIAHIAKTSTDGKWRAPDSLGYNEHIGAVAAIVSQHLEEALTRRFGLQWIARDDGHGFEIKGISGEMMRVFSSRRESINADLRVRAARFEQRYGRKPSNGCGADGCSGGALNVRTGPVTAADITTTPGAYQCFYVTALNKAGASTSTNPGCTFHARHQHPIHPGMDRHRGHGPRGGGRRNQRDRRCVPQRGRLLAGPRRRSILHAGG